MLQVFNRVFVVRDIPFVASPQRNMERTSHSDRKAGRVVFLRCREERHSDLLVRTVHKKDPTAGP